MSVSTQRRAKRKLETGAMIPTNSRNFKMSKRGVHADAHSICFVDWDHHLHKGVQEESKQRVEDEDVRAHQLNKQVLDEEKRAAEALALLQSFPVANDASLKPPLPFRIAKRPKPIVKSVEPKRGKKISVGRKLKVSNAAKYRDMKKKEAKIQQQFRRGGESESRGRIKDKILAYYKFKQKQQDFNHLAPPYMTELDVYVILRHICPALLGNGKKFTKEELMKTIVKFRSARKQKEKKFYAKGETTGERTKRLRDDRSKVLNEVKQIFREKSSIKRFQQKVGPSKEKTLLEIAKFIDEVLR